MLLFISGPINRMFKGKSPHEPSESVVLITGCDSGFGLYMAKKLRKKGYIVVSTCLTEEGSKYLEHSHGVVTLKIDLCKPGAYTQVGNTVKATIAANPGSYLWAVVNNAGIAPVGFLDWMTMDRFRQAMEINYFAMVGITKELLPLLKKNAQTRIVNLSSMAGLSASVNFGPYSGSKHAVEGYSKALRLELLPFEIYVCNVNPGFMATPLITNSMNKAQLDFDSASEDVKKFYNKEVLSGNGDNILRIQEAPSKVGDYIVDHLLTVKKPSLTNYVGIQANSLRWFLMLPQAMQEKLINLGTAVKGINYNAVQEEHRKGKEEREAAKSTLVIGGEVKRGRSSSPRRTANSRSRSRKLVATMYTASGDE